MNTPLSPSSSVPLDLSREEWLSMFRSMPLLDLGQLAFAEKQRRYGNRVTYIVNRQINPTNLCVYSCKFCDFAAKSGDAYAYVLDEREIEEMISDPEIREVHVVGGLHPKWGFRRSLDLIHSIRSQRPDLWIKAFTAVEVAYFARMERHDDYAQILGAMIDARVDQMPGGGAEVLSERLHELLYPDKIAPRQWLAIHQRAHELGLKTNATLMFGHLETDEEIVEHLLKLRHLQAQTGGFQSFIPLVYQPGTTKLVPQMASSTRCLRVIALSRLILDNIPHVKAYWPSLQVETAAAALTFGADDLDGTIGQERIMQLAGTLSPAQLTRRRMEQLARHAGQELVERDGDFEPTASQTGGSTRASAVLECV